MKQRLHSNQIGIAHLMLILVVVLVIGVGGAGYYVWNKNKDKDSASSSQTATNKAIEDECKKAIEDSDFCKFASNINFDEAYKSVIATTSSEGDSVITLESDGNGGTKAVTTVNGAEVASYVSIGNTSYMKDQSDGAWYKFTNESSEDVNVSDDLDIDFEDDPSTPENDAIQYKKIGKEACGDDTCFKYQIIDPANPTDEQFVWFDDEDYKLRRYSFKNAEGSGEITYSYEAVTITEPSPTKEMTSPDAMSPEELEQLLQQYMTE